MSNALPQKRWTRRRVITVLLLLVIAADIDMNGNSCGCDDFAPRVSAVRMMSA